MPVNTPTLYRPSGKMGLLPALAVLLLLLGIPLLSAIYAYMEAYVLELKIKAIFSVVYAFLVMGLVVAVCLVGRCRNGFAAGMLALLAGIISLYCAWVVFAYALIARWEGSGNVEILQILFNPTALWSFASSVGETGWYRRDGSEVKGGVLWSIWTAEALMIVLVPVIGTMKVLNDKLFCEECGTWTKKVSSRATFAPTGDPIALKALQVGSIMPFELLQPILPSGTPQFALDTWDCEKCGLTHALQVRHVIQKVSSNEKPKLIQKFVTPIYLLDPESHQRLLAVCEKQPELEPLPEDHEAVDGKT